MMMPIRLNPLALFAVALGIGSVVTNWSHAGSTPWLLGAASGAVAMLFARMSPAIVGTTLGMAAVLLTMASILGGFPVPIASPLALALTSGSCAGALLSLLACWALKIPRESTEGEGA